MIRSFEREGWTASELNNWRYNTSQSNVTTAREVQRKVDDWVSLGGPNHGTTTASFCFEASCVEMRVNSTFLRELNREDETPGAVSYGTWWSSCDEIINPDESVLLTGATNTEAGCVTHVGLTSNATVFGQVRDFVR